MGSVPSERFDDGDQDNPTHLLDSLSGVRRCHRCKSPRGFVKIFVDFYLSLELPQKAGMHSRPLRTMDRSSFRQYQLLPGRDGCIQQLRSIPKVLGGRSHHVVHCP